MLVHGGQELGIFGEFVEPKKTWGVIREFCATSWKIITNKTVSPHCDIRYARKNTLAAPQTLLLELTVLSQITIININFFMITHGKVSLWVRKSLENLEKFFLLFCDHHTVLDSTAEVCVRDAGFCDSCYCSISHGLYVCLIFSVSLTLTSPPCQSQ